MLCKTPAALAKVCNNNPSGISGLWLYDPLDFTWTQPTVANGTGALTVVARATGATAIGGALMYKVALDNKDNAGNYEAKRTLKNRKPKYEHNINVKYEELSQTLTDWLSTMDATACCGVGMVIRLNSGKILVAGQRVIGGVEIAYPLQMLLEDSTISSGKASDDFQGGDLNFKGDHNLPLNEFTGNISVIIGFES